MACSIRVHLLLIRSVIHVFFIVLVEGRLSKRWVWKLDWNVPSSVTKTCEYHDILSYFGISQVMFKIETSKHIKLGYLNLNMHIPI